MLIPKPTVEKPRNIVIRRTLCHYPTSKNNAPPRQNLLAIGAAIQQLMAVELAGSMVPEGRSSLAPITTGSNMVNVQKRGF